MPIHPSAIIHPTAQIDPTAEIGPYVDIGQNCVIGPGNVLMTGAIINRNTVLGSGNKVHHHALLGGDPQYVGFDPETPSGTIIGNNNIFREFCQVHRAYKPGEKTVIGDNCYLMATSHIGHDCHLGNNVIMVNFSGFAGHVVCEDKVFVSGHVGVHQFCRIGTMAMLGGRTGISKDVPPYTIVKHYGEVVGVNVIGLLRNGVDSDSRSAIRNAYKELFRSGNPLPQSIQKVRDQWSGRTMPAELQHFLDFCSTKSKRGISHGPRTQGAEVGDSE